MTIFKNIYLMIAGTSLSQIIIVFSSPVLTRLYPPESFGVFKIFVSTVAVLSVIANLRYELAIVLPEKKADALNILRLTLVSNVVIFFTVLILTIPSFQILENNVFNNLGNLKYLIPFSVFFGALFQALNFWFNRQKDFKTISISKVIQSSFVSLIQILIGWFFFGNASGLIIGSISGQILSLLYFIFIALRDDDFKNKPYLNKNNLIRVALSYKRFPFFSAPGAFINTASSEFPVFIISYSFGLSLVGQYGLAIRLLGLPLTLISSSIYQVLVSKIAELSRDSPHRIKSLLTKFFILLFIPTFFLAVIFSSFSISIFTLIFGVQWHQAGEIASIIVFAYVFKFSISPLACVLGLEENVHLGFYWQLLYFISIIIVLLFSTSLDFIKFVKIFTLFEISIYTIYLLFIFYGAKKIEGKP